MRFPWLCISQESLWPRMRTNSCKHIVVMQKRVFHNRLTLPTRLNALLFFHLFPTVNLCLLSLRRYGVYVVCASSPVSLAQDLPPEKPAKPLLWWAVTVRRKYKPMVVPMGTNCEKTADRLSTCRLLSGSNASMLAKLRLEE
jgi:hypothetical protein